MTLRSGEIKNIDYLTKEELPGGFSNEMPAPIPPQIEALTPKQVLDLASDIAGLIEKNPALGIRRNREKSRDRFLQADEMQRFFQSLSEEPNEKGNRPA